MAMIFYIDNQIDNKVVLSYKELIEHFISNKKAYDNLMRGQAFERCFLSVLPGTPEPLTISDYDWEKLWKEFKRQVPNPDYKG